MSGADLGICIRVLFLKLRPDLLASPRGCELSSPTCMFDLTYLLGTLKNVTTGSGGGMEIRIGGNTQLAMLQETTKQLI